MTPKAAIKEILDALDHTDDALWTDDGGPRMDVIQKLANDNTLTRAQVNDASPGFVRVSAEARAAAQLMAEPAQTSEVQAAPDEAEFNPRLEPEVNGSGAPLTEDEVRAILLRRVRDAETALTAARAATSEARMEEAKCEKRLNRAHIDQQRHFPPISEAENIHAHIANQQRMLMERVTGIGGDGRSQLDVSMERSNKRGWTRPVRAVQAVG